LFGLDETQQEIMMMTHSAPTPHPSLRPRFWLGLAAIGAALALPLAPSRAEPPAFAGFSGSWSGSGTISLADGSRERLRCRATYRVAGAENRLEQSLRCASDSYRFDLSSDVTSEGGRLSGTWSESSRNINGNLSGRVNGGHVAAAVDAPGFTANLNLNTQGNRQSVSITSEGDIRNVSIALVRG
jgi:hypothetical protein